jgi:hypothetical protein
MPRLAALAPTILLATIAATACGPRRIALPAGPGTPVADHAEAFATALIRCQDVRTLQAELGLSGSVGRQRVRGRVLAGLVPGALRLEGVAPIGSPGFILVAEGSRGTLLLLRDRRVLRDAPAADILNALVGIALGPDDLRAVLSGCVKASRAASGARQYGPDWMAVDLASGGTIYLRRQDRAWRVVAGRYSGLEIEYSRFSREPSLPSQILIRSSPAAGDATVTLSVGVSQAEVNGELPRDQLVAVRIPSGLSPISLQELRDAGPLGQ